MQQPEQALELLNVVTERVSHSLRTQAGISLGVLKDHLDGIALHQTDYKDALQAQLKILDLIESMSPMRGSFGGKEQQFDLLELIQSELSCFETLEAVPTFTTDLLTEPIVISCNQLLMRRVLHSLLVFSSAAWKRYGKCGNPDVRFTRSSRNQHKLRVAIVVKEGTEDILPCSFRAYAKSDHSIEALHLLFIDTALSVLNGSSKIFLTNESERPLLVLTLTFDREKIDDREKIE